MLVILSFPRFRNPKKKTRIEPAEPLASPTAKAPTHGAAWESIEMVEFVVMIFS